MALPEEFNEFEFLQDTFRKTMNHLVLEEFQELGGADWDADITSSRGALRHACTHKDDDTGLMGIMRAWILYFILRKAQDLQQPFYGIPIEEFQQVVKFKPQVTLYFIEDAHEVERGYNPLRSQISFRLMHETAESLSHADLEQYAHRIRSIFASGNGFEWQRGKILAVYADKPRGYNLQLLIRSEAEAKRVIERVMEIQEHAPNWAYLKYSQNAEPSEAYPTNPPTETIVGKPRRLPRKRPIGTVRFSHATLDVWGLNKPIVLVDTNHHFRNAIVAA